MSMKGFGRTIGVMIITFIVIIAIFWFVLPMTGVADIFGNSYIFVALIGSFIISYIVSWGLNKAFSGSKRK
ncbi:MAG: hypothetical protein ACMUHB_02245 [Thermoplasmatota archaeon]